MPRGADFRMETSFSVTSVKDSGLSIGKKIYWKLYAVENFYRMIIHSILVAQIGPNWWSTAVDQTIQGKAHQFKQKYLKRPWHTLPGTHDIYYIDLTDLNEIVRANSNLFSYLIPDIHEWIVRVETLRLPRNVVAHMNFPNGIDEKRIDVVYEDFKNLVVSSLIPSSLNLQIPS